MKTSLEHRLALVKARLGGEAIVLHLPDGTTRRINGSSKHYFKLAALLDSDGESPLHAELQAVRDCIAIDEGGRHVFELLRVLLQGAAEGEEDGPQ